MKAVVWVQHLLGTGHAVRAAAIGRALAGEGVATTLVLGARPPQTLDLSGMQTVELASVRATDGSFLHVVGEEGRPYETLMPARRDALLAVIDRVRPDIFLTETYPFGRRRFAQELAPALAVVRERGGVVASSIRDVLVRKPAAKEAQMADLALRAYDRVLVHADPAFTTLGESFAAADRLAPLLRYTGYVDGGPVPVQIHEAGRAGVVVSAGGSGVGAALVSAAIEAARLSPPIAWRILVPPALGPQMAAWRKRAPSHVTLEPNRADFRALLARAALSISQAGYNTVLDVLCAGPRMILVPFAVHEETEQTDRAAALCARNLATVVPESALSPHTLSEAVARALAGPLPDPPSIDRNGARCSAAILMEDAA
ncbi:MAG: glycosyltransferase [Pseudomonadota bacterium]